MTSLAGVSRRVLASSSLSDRDRKGEAGRAGRNDNVGNGQEFLDLRGMEGGCDAGTGGRRWSSTDEEM